MKAFLKCAACMVGAMLLSPLVFNLSGGALPLYNCVWFVAGTTYVRWAL